jgi:hypothetical protein
MEIYVMDSLLSRVTQRFTTEAGDAIWITIARALCGEKFYAIATSARKILCSILENKALEKSLKDLDIFLNNMLLKTDTITLKQRIAEDLYENGKYGF